MPRGGAEFSQRLKIDSKTSVGHVRLSFQEAANAWRGTVASFEGVFVDFPILHDDDEVFLWVLDELDVGGRVAVH